MGHHLINAYEYDLVEWLKKATFTSTLGFDESTSFHDIDSSTVDCESLVVAADDRSRTQIT